MEYQNILPVLYNTLEVYDTICKPVCKKYNLPMTAFDILMFLSSHPGFDTAKDIVRFRGLPPNLVSRYVELLAQRGLLSREPVEGNRRSIRLTCTEKAEPLIEEGYHFRQRFFNLLFDGISPEELETFKNILSRCGRNVMQSREAMKRKNRRTAEPYEQTNPYEQAKPYDQQERCAALE